MLFFQFLCFNFNFKTCLLTLKLKVSFKTITYWKVEHKQQSQYRAKTA